MDSVLLLVVLETSQEKLLDEGWTWSFCWMMGPILEGLGPFVGCTGDVTGEVTGFDGRGPILEGLGPFVGCTGDVTGEVTGFDG
ncbi:hypothetical protein Gasu2_62590 [Galdieria sulphuraria]|nr:hypothetical protein Gasu2_62590 [Galdieria sulphuraria]